jgi:ComF family protein
MERGVINQILDIIFPLECLSCGKENILFCESCRRKLIFTTTQSCPFCGKINTTGKTCSLCQKNFALNGIFAAGDYNQKEIKEIVKHLKYHFVKKMADELGLFILNCLKSSYPSGNDLFNKNYLIAPIPLSKERGRWRGFNQSKLIADKISAAIGAKELSGLIKVRNSKPQANLSGQKRKNNLSNCFNYIGENLSKKKIILVDDVATTGTTLEEAAKVLKNNGAETIWGLVAAKG